MNNYKELKVWMKAIDLSVKAYEISRTFPQTELFGLITQIQRAAVSIAANISEGAGRNSDKEFVHFLGISNGSAYELNTHLVISNRIGYLSNEDYAEMSQRLDEIEKMLNALMKSKS
ncbi:MAG: four helix bundle protein [Bacteroidales bacterium]|nr:four helix bundle protein [Bacteroidales bacterium]